jgi:Uma2 family endonuclease
MTQLETTVSKPILLDVSTVRLHVTNEQFDRLAQANPDLRLELTPNGELIVMPPTFAISGKRNSDLVFQVVAWNRRTKLGEVFDSSTGYDWTAIGSGRYSPDVSWIENARLVGVDLQHYLTIVPDFAIELRSSSDRLKDVRGKMREYMRCGVRLSWLINPQDRQVEIYRLGKAVEVLDSPISVGGENVLPEFILDLTTIY